MSVSTGSSSSVLGAAIALSGVDVVSSATCSSAFDSGATSWACIESACIKVLISMFELTSGAPDVSSEAAGKSNSTLRFVSLASLSANTGTAVNVSRGSSSVSSVVTADWVATSLASDCFCFSTGETFSASPG